MTNEGELRQRAIEIVNRHCEYHDGLNRGQYAMKTENAIAAVMEALSRPEPTEALIERVAIEDALETARQRACVLFNAYALGVSMEHARGEEQFKSDVQAFEKELRDALKFPISRRTAITGDASIVSEG